MNIYIVDSPIEVSFSTPLTCPLEWGWLEEIALSDFFSYILKMKKLQTQNIIKKLWKSWKSNKSIRESWNLWESKIPHEKHEYHENHKNPLENQENHENHRTPFDNYENNKIL